MYIISGYNINEFKVKGSLFKSYTYEVNNNTHKGNLKLFRKKELQSEKKNISTSMNLIFN